MPGTASALPSSDPLNETYRERHAVIGGLFERPYYKHLYHGQNDMRRGTEVVDLSGQYSTDLLADAACDFIRRHASQPEKLEELVRHFDQWCAGIAADSSRSLSLRQR